MTVPLVTFTNKSMRGAGDKEEFREKRERTPQEKITRLKRAKRLRVCYEVFKWRQLYTRTEKKRRVLGRERNARLTYCKKIP